MVSDVDLRVGGSDAAASSLRPTVAFLRRAAEHGWPANVIVLVHTECHPTTGALFYGNREQDSAYSNLPDLLAAFLGGEMKAAMADGKAKALEASRPVREHWFQESAASRGGWRALILASGGASIRIPSRKDEVIALVEQ
jgi:hypothetical protein